MPRTLPKFPSDTAIALKPDPDDRHPSSALNSVKPPERLKASLLRKYVMVGAVMSAVAVVGIPTLLSQQQPRVLSIRANDLSASALEDIAIAQKHCRTVVRSLKGGDDAISIGFADRPEVLPSRPVGDLFAPSQECEAIRRDRIPKTLGREDGTDPNALLEEVQTQLKSRRVRGNHNSGVITIWLQNAEPRPGQVGFDIKRLQVQLQQITSDRSTIAIFGPAGQLRSDLEKAIQNNPQVDLCSIDSSETCVQQAFVKGRRLP